MLKAIRILKVLLAGAVLTCSAIPATAASTHVYIVLGNSLAFGFLNSTLSSEPSYGLQGYVGQCALFLKALDNGTAPVVVNLAVPGETSSSFFTGSAGDRLNLNYTEPTKQTQSVMFAEALSIAKSRHYIIDAISIQLGGDDLLQLADNPSFAKGTLSQQEVLVQTAMNKLAENYSDIYDTFHSAAPSTPLYIVGYYNPLASDPSNSLYRIAGPAVAALNTRLEQLAALAGATYVDVSTPFTGKIADYIYMATLGFPNGLHPNPAGYAVLAQAIKNTHYALDTVAPAMTTLPIKSTGLSLTATGGGFVSGDVVYFAGKPVTTKFVSETELTAVVPASAIKVVGKYSILVQSAKKGSTNTLYLVVK